MDKNSISHTAIVYVNAPPHIVFALELLQADVLARYHRSIGDDTRFLTETDEHGATVVKGAAKAGKDVKEFVDGIAEKVRDLTKILDISNDDFIRPLIRHATGRVLRNFGESLRAEAIFTRKLRRTLLRRPRGFMKKSDLVEECARFTRQNRKR